jgi:hypothetical protein
MNSNNKSPVLELEKLQENINLYRRLSASNPKFLTNIEAKEKKYANKTRNIRMRNIERSVSPGTVRSLIEQLNTGSAKSSPSTSPAIFTGGRRRRGRRNRTRRGRGRRI